MTSSATPSARAAMRNGRFIVGSFCFNNDATQRGISRMPAAVTERLLLRLLLRRRGRRDQSDSGGDDGEARDQHRPVLRDVLPRALVELLDRLRDLRPLQQRLDGPN